jgi:hypothetical protein
MIDQRRSVPILATLILALAACGGSGTSGAPAASPAALTVASDAGAGAGGGPVAGNAASAEASSEPSAEPAPGGGSIADVCALVTNDELAGILGTAVTTEVFAGPPDTCQVGSTDGAGLAAFVLTDMTGVSASLVYDSYAGSPTATEIGGIGEKAAYDPSQGSLVVLKSGAVLAVSVFDDGSGSTDEAARLDQMKKIGTIAAGRM